MQVPRACPEEAQADTSPVEDPLIPRAATRLKLRVPAMEATIASGLHAITHADPFFQNGGESISSNLQMQCRDRHLGFLSLPRV